MRLLLAEDEIDLSNTIKKVLEMNQYDVDAVYDGEAALDMLEFTNYDGVLLDVMMPKKDGYTVVKEMRQKGNSTPVMILTAKSQIDDKVTGLDAGADDYLTKPFAIKELLARVRALCRRKGGDTPSYSVGNMTLNPGTFEISTDKGSARLTSKEFKLMELLIRNQGVLLSTAKIMDSVWEYDTEAEINVVWVFISSLRKKMDSIESTCEIKAVRGVGYRLEVK